MQLTEEQADAWAEDANVMLNEETLGSAGVRAAAQALLQSLVTAGGAAAVAGLQNALQRRLEEAAAAKVLLQGTGMITASFTARAAGAGRTVGLQRAMCKSLAARRARMGKSLVCTRALVGCGFGLNTLPPLR